MLMTTRYLTPSGPMSVGSPACGDLRPLGLARRRDAIAGGQAGALKDVLRVPGLVVKDPSAFVVAHYLDANELAKQAEAF